MHWSTTCRCSDTRQLPSGRAWLTAGALLLWGAALPAQEGDAGDQQAKAAPLPVPRGLVSQRGETRIYIDGSLQDWPSAMPLVLDDPRQLSGTAVGAWRGPDDLRARAFLLWDAEDLFVAVVVEDDWHRPLTEDSPRDHEVPPADNVLLSFDPRRDTRAIGADAGRDEDRAFWLADTGNERRQVVLWDRLRGIARYAADAVGVVVRDHEQQRTIYEARLPWGEILPEELSAAPGLVLDLSLIVSDYDEITDTIAQTRVGWTFGSGVRIDPALHGSVMLVEDGERYDELPPFPPPPDRAIEPGESYWLDLWRALRATRPTAVTAGAASPREAMDQARVEALERLEAELARFPRVDFLDYHHRAHRRMRREAGGMTASSLPFFWQHALEHLARDIAAAAPERGVRLFRLPVGGWVVRTPELVFAIDPAGYDLEGQIAGAFAAVLLTNPGELTKRSDQVLLRMAAAKRPIFTHRTFHLPGVDGAHMPLVTIGATVEAGDGKVRVVGTRDGDLVSPTVGYVVTAPGGTVIVHSGLSMTPEQLVEAVPAPGRVDLLILSAEHFDAVALAAAVDTRLVVLDDVLQAPSSPRGRISLADAIALQARLLPRPSMIVGPGESVDIAPGQ
jgi:hypothetical protein